MSKRSFYFITIILVMIVLSACGNDKEVEVDTQDTIVLKAGSNLPTNHINMVNSMVPFIERVEEETNGRVQFEVYDSESLVRAGEELEALRAGTIDIAIPMYEAYDLSRFPLTEVPMLPVTKTDRDINGEALSIMWGSSEPYEDGETFVEKMYGSQDLVVWPSGASKSYTIATVGKPIESLDELQSLQLRSPSNIHDLFSANIGASPIKMSINETFDALNRGTLDGGYSIMEDWKSYGFQEVYTYAIDGLNLGLFPASIAMTEEKFNSLPEDIQEIISTAASEMPIPKHNPIINENMEVIEADIIETFLESGGQLDNISDLPQDVQDAIEQAIVDTWHDWIEAQEDKGQPGLETAIKWRDSIIEAGGDVPDKIKELEL